MRTPLKRSALAPWSIPAPSSIGAFALQTPIPVISSVSYRVLKLNIYKPGFPRSTNFVECVPIWVTSWRLTEKPQGRQKHFSPYLMLLHAHGAESNAAVGPGLSHEPLLLWVAGMGNQDRNRVELAYESLDNLILVLIQAWELTGNCLAETRSQSLGPSVIYKNL